MTRCPIPHDPAAGLDVSREFGDLPPELRAVLAGAAGCSLYLHGLMLRDAGWLREALAGSPERAMDAVMLPLAALAGDQLGAGLRLAKRRVALLVALADLSGVWTLEMVTGALTRLADAAVAQGLQQLVGDEIRRGRLPGASAEDAATGAGMVVLAMGKMGAGELNYSSDIDLICLFDESRYLGVEAEARAAFVRVTRRLTALLSDQTGAGYVFRTDLRLRPDAAVTPVCLSMAAAEGYYESVGRTWERAAYIKARPCAGDLVAGGRFLQALVPFVWRRHLDFAAIKDAHDMRLRIRDHRGLHGPVVLEGHNMKLGVGGIREIEFFTQTRQIISGGRDPDLRLRQTVGGLAALATKGWVAGDIAEELTGNYRAHREVEHRLQMLADAQTHDLPATPEGFDRLARFMGAGDTDAFRQALKHRLTATAALTEGFFAPVPSSVGSAASVTMPALSDMAKGVVEGWHAYPALRSPRAVEIFARVRPQVLQALVRAEDPEAALLQFDSFLKGLPAGVQVFSLFDANPQLVELMVDIAATAPNLARYLAQNAAVLDAVIGGSFFAPWPGVAGLTEALTGALDRVADYERKLDAARRWAKEWHFRVGVHHLRGLIDAFGAGQQYADLAEAVVAAVWPTCVVEFARKHGQPPGRGAVVLGMGSLGAGRLNASSDLDLIVIYDPAGVESSAGPRPLNSRTYFARLTQALVTALTVPMAEGRLYEVDMRLRPSGRQGPVATALQGFRDYQMREAWTWEHLALTRARVMAGDSGLAADVEAFRRLVIAQMGQRAAVLTDAADMRARLSAAKPAEGVWDVKQVAGGLMEVELLAETAAFRAGNAATGVEAQIAGGVSAGWLHSGAADVILAAYQLCWRVQACARLLAERKLDPTALGEGGKGFLLRETGVGDLNALELLLRQRCAACAAELDRVLRKGTGNGTAGS